MRGGALITDTILYHNKKYYLATTLPPGTATGPI